MGRMKYFQWKPSPIGPYPDVGSQPSCTAKSRMNIRPTQKLGAATPNSDVAEMKLSSQVKGRSPAMMPSGIEKTTPTVSADRVSGMVRLNFSQTSDDTGWLALYDRETPMSPLSSLPIQMAYWTYTGSLRPSSSRSISRASRVASMPSLVTAGSPGAYLTKANITNERTTRT